MMTASEHRARAREALRGKWLWAVLTAFVAMVTGAIAGSGAEFEIEITETETVSLNNLPESVQTLLVSVLGWSLVVGVVVATAIAVVQLILGGVVGIGYRKYLLNVIDGEEAVFDQLFSQFHRLGQAVLLRLLRGLIGWIPGTVMVAMVPLLVVNGMGLLAFGGFILILVLCGVGIYVGYGFEMCEFIMAEDEACGAVDALKRSWQMMNGQRVRLWCLELSFIGWGILAGFTPGIGGLFLTPYVQTAIASFYREMKPKTVPLDGYSDYAGLNEGYTETE